jgi:hypothetical protein
MKQLLTVALLVLGLSVANAQSSFNLQVLQDARLAVSDDDNGNEAFTPNLLFGIEYQHLQKYRSVGYMTYGLTYEYADLFGGPYNRVGTTVGYNFNTILDGVEFGLNASYGGIHRFQDWYGSYGGNAFIAINVVDNIQLTANLQYTQRSDLNFNNNEYSPLSGFIGFKFNFLNCNCTKKESVWMR